MFPIFYLLTCDTNLHQNTLSSFTSREGQLNLTAFIDPSMQTIDWGLAVCTIRRLFHATHCFKRVTPGCKADYNCLKITNALGPGQSPGRGSGGTTSP